MHYHNTAISFGRTKEAALYFDYVIPIYSIIDSFDPQTKSFTHHPPWRDLANTDMLPNELCTHDFIDKLITVNSKTADFMIKTLRFSNSVINEEEYNAATDSTSQITVKFLQEFQLIDMPLIVNSSTIAETRDSSADISITLGAIRVIDISQASWAQVTELRRDPEARKKLRRLRLFVVENYAGKSKAFIEDDLLRRIDDYEEQVRRWGFETKQSVLAMLLTSKYLVGALSGSLISILFGAPAAAIASMAAGAVVEIGRVSLEVSKKRFLLRNALRDNPVSYIVDAKKKLSKDK